MTPYARYACTQGQFAPYYYASARPFEVCPYPGATPYTLCPRARANCTLSLCFSQPLWSESWKLQRINGTTVVGARIPDFAAYTIDGGLLLSFRSIYWSFEALRREIRNVREQQPFSRHHTVRMSVTGANKFGPQNPGGQNLRTTDVQYTIATSTRQPRPKYRWKTPQHFHTPWSWNTQECSKGAELSVKTPLWHRAEMETETRKRNAILMHYTLKNNCSTWCWWRLVAISNWYA